MAEVAFLAADRLEDWSVEVGERMVLDTSAPSDWSDVHFFFIILLMKIQSARVPTTDGDVIHAGVVSELEVHDVVVARGVAVLVEHHHIIRHVGEFEFSQIFLKTFNFSALLKFYMKEFF